MASQNDSSSSSGSEFVDPILSTPMTIMMITECVFCCGLFFKADFESGGSSAHITKRRVLVIAWKIRLLVSFVVQALIVKNMSGKDIPSHNMQ